MNIVKKLYWSKYRPSSIEGMILLPRIQKQILDKEGNIVLSNNLLFTGSPGIGKSSLANVIVPKGALRVNASYNSSIDDLKDNVIDFCRTADIFEDNTLNGYKVVYLDEFDGVSQKYQEALRGFMEEYTNIRFIATANNISKISDAIQSRFQVIKFDPINQEETEYLKQEYLERAVLIKDKNNLQVSEEELKSIINITFPDMRSVMNTLQNIEQTGGYNVKNITGLNIDLYNLIFSDIKEDKTYDWVITNYGDRVENLLKMCGRPLCKYIFESKPEHINKVPNLIFSVNNHLNELNNTPDPVVLALSCIYEIQQIIKK